MFNKLIANRFLTVPAFNQSPPPPNPAYPANFAVVPNLMYNIQESTSSGFVHRHKTSQVVGGAHGTKTHRTFRWLPWVLGKVSCVRLAGPDVLTGRMSGCWLVIFLFNGHRYAGHIGTDTDPNTSNSVQAKAAWRNAVNANQITPVAAFNPVGNGLPALNQLNIKNEAPEFYGGYDQASNVYTVVLTAPGHGGTTRRIARVVRMQTTPDVTAF